MNDLGTKEKVLRRLYNRMLILLALVILTTVIIAKPCVDYLDTRPGISAILLFIPAAVGVAGSLWQRRSLRKNGITNEECRSYWGKQPFSRAATAITVVVVIAKFLKLFK
jgi:hypothetical protein